MPCVSKCSKMQCYYQTSISGVQSEEVEVSVLRSHVSKDVIAQESE